MKFYKLLFISIFYLMFFQIQANAQVANQEKIIDKVISSLQLLFGDTIEEGGIEAKILKSQSTCRSSLQDTKKNFFRHFCSLAIKITDTNVEREDNSCVLNCSINYFTVGEDLNTLTANKSQINTCLETLSSSCW